jgi:RNA polymerase sigma-70 factor (ECF subfamily)
MSQQSENRYDRSSLDLFDNLSFPASPAIDLDPALVSISAAKKRLAAAIGSEDSALSTTQKQSILSVVGHCWNTSGNDALASRSLPATSDAWSRLAQKLVQHTPLFRRKDIDELRSMEFSDEAIMDGVLTIALGQMVWTEFSLVQVAKKAARSPLKQFPPLIEWTEPDGPFFSPPPQWDKCDAINVLCRHFGFVPRVYQEQTLRPNVLDAEVALTNELLSSRILPRVHKELIALAVSADNLNTYSVAAQGQILSTLGVSWETSKQVVDQQTSQALSPEILILIDETRKLACRTHICGSEFNRERLTRAGFSSSQIVEAITMAAFTNFLNTAQAGLGSLPDFAPQRIFSEKDLYPFSEPVRPISHVTSEQDPDADLVARVQAGETDCFEELVRRSSRRVFGTLAGVLGNTEDARDAAQEVFLKAFENIRQFRRQSRFSTWITSIAINTATDLLRQRKPLEPLVDGEGEEGFRPLLVKSWVENPEQSLSASQRANLVKTGILRLPQKYRVAILLRDLNQLSTEEAATALGISEPALKARVLRGRLMLRENLAPHFIRQTREGSA